MTCAVGFRSWGGIDVAGQHVYSVYNTVNAMNKAPGWCLRGPFCC